MTNSHHRQQGNHHHNQTKKTEDQHHHDEETVDDAAENAMPPAPTPPPTPTSTPVEPPAPSAPSTAPAVAPVVAATGVFGRYENWVVANTSLARNIETALYIAPQLVPKSMSDPDVATQSGYSMVGLLGLYHDYILYKTANKEAMGKADKLTQLVRVPLSLVSHVQVLAEVTAGKFGGEVSRWRLIVWVELFKSVCKLLLLLQQRRGLLIGAAKYKSIHPPGTKKSPFARFSKSQKAGSRTGKVFGGAANKTVDDDSAASPAEATAAAGPTSITFDDPAFVVGNVNEKQLLGGELLHIFRPVAYAVLRQRKDETSWAPAVVSLLMEAAGLLLSTSAVKEAKAVTPKKAEDELAARKMALLLYLLRDPIFASVTKPATEKLCGATDYVPVFGKFFRLVSVGILDYYHKFHFYTSAS